MHKAQAAALQGNACLLYTSGIPVDIHADTGLPAVTVVYTILHAGGKFGVEYLLSLIHI